MAALNWCELYVDGKTSCKDLANLVLNVVEGEITFTDGRSRWEIETRLASISVEENENCRESDSATYEDFLFYPLLVSAEQFPEAPKAQYEQQIGEVVSRIRDGGYRVSVMADFSDDCGS